MAATIDFAQGVLSVQGDGVQPNNVRVFTQLRAGNLVAMAGNVRRQVPLADVVSINIIGGSGNDRIVLAEGLKVPAVIEGGAGNDALYGGAGNDTLYGGTGNDRLVGRRGNDRLVGGGGADLYYGGPGRNSYDRSQPQPAPVPQDPVPDPGTGPVLQAPYPDSVVERPIALQHPYGGQFSLGRNVKLFRNADGSLVAGDGVQDDTTGIQRAIDSLPNSTGVPQGGVASGGTIFLPPGTYRITRPLQVPGGVIVSGSGPGTVLHYVGRSGAAVEFVEDPELPVDFCAGAGATNMTVRADHAGGFAVRSAERLHLQLMRFRDLVIDTAGWGINLLAGDSSTQNCFFDNVLFRNVGQGALFIRGNANKLNAIRVEGELRPGYNPTPGVVVVQGAGTSISNSLVSGAIADAAVPFYVSGVSDGVGGGLVKFRNNRVDAPGVSGPNGLPRFVFDQLGGGSLVDDLGQRKAKFVNCRGLRIARQWVDGSAADLGRYLEADADTRVLVDQVYSPQQAGAGNDPRGRVRVTRWHVGTLADYQADRGNVDAELPPSPALPPARLAVGVNVREFVCDDGVSVRGDGVHDDTTGIQAAINLFLANRENPTAPRSGAVYLPTGTYRITAPLTLPSGVMLVGDGSGTAIMYTGSGGVAVRFDDPTGTVTNAGVENLGIGADNAGGIGAAAGVTVSNSRISDVVLNVSGWGIDLRDLRDSSVSNVHQKQLGAGAVRIDATRSRIHAVNTEFGVRAGFNADPAIVVVRGNYNSITGCVIEGVPGGSAHAYYASGTGLTFGNNWAEMTNNVTLEAKGRIAFIFQNVRDARIEELYLLNSQHRAQFINSQVTIAVLDTLAETHPLKDYIVMDAASSLRLELGVTWWGLGAAATGFVQTLQELVLLPGGNVYQYGTWTV